MDNLNKYIDKIPDVNDADKMIEWIELENSLIYVEGFCDECLSGAGFPTIENGGTQDKLNYIEDLTENILKQKSKDRNLKLITHLVIELPDASNLYSVIVAKFIKREL